MHMCRCVYMYIFLHIFLWLGLTLISTMRWDLPLISGVILKCEVVLFQSQI